MPRRKIGADLKEALCKLYEAGDISADTIEKHGIMSRATFFRNLKMYKTGASLEQRHSTGRKTNADKLKELEKQELDSLQPLHLSHLELVLLLDEDERNLQGVANRQKRKAKTVQGSSKTRDVSKVLSGDAEGNDNATIGEESGSESEGEADEASSLATGQALDRLTQAVKSFLINSDGESSNGSESSDTFADLDSLLRPEDSHYSNSNRGALFIVRHREEKKQGDGTGEIVAAIALRSLIWTPQVYQALGPSYASRSIDKVCYLTRLRVDSMWQRKGIGRWLVHAAEHKACKLGFSHLYTQSDVHRAELLTFWNKAGFQEFARLDDKARFEKKVEAPTLRSKGGASKRAIPSAPVTTQLDGTVAVSSSAPVADATPLTPGKVAYGEAVPGIQWAGAQPLASAEAETLEMDPTLSMHEATALPSTTGVSTPRIVASSAAAPLSMTTTSATHLETSSKTHPTASYASHAINLEQPSSLPELDVPSEMSVPALPRATAHDATAVQAEPPPRKIAFHEADSVKGGPAS